MAFEDDWQQLIAEEADVYNRLSPAKRDKLVRIFARKVARREVSGSDPRMKSFLEANLSKAAAPELPGLASEAKRSFLQSDVGTIGGTLAGAQLPAPEEPPSPMMSRIEAAYKRGLLPAAAQTGREAYRAAKGAAKTAAQGTYGVVTSPLTTAGDVISGGLDVLGTEIQSGGIGTRSAAGAVAGVLPDIIVQGATGFGAGKLATKALAKAAPMLAKTAAPIAGVAGSAVPDYLTPYTAAKMRGSTQEQAEIAGLLGSGTGAAFGLLGAAGAMRGQPAAAAQRAVRQGPSNAPAINLATPKQLRQFDIDADGNPIVPQQPAGVLPIIRSRGASRDLQQFRDSRAGMAPAPSEMWTPGGLPIGARPAQALRRLPPGEPVLQLPERTPSTIAAQEAATQQALYGQVLPAPVAPIAPAAPAAIPLPPVMQTFGDVTDLVARRQAAQQAYDSLLQSGAPMTPARQAQIQQASQDLIEARQMEMNAISQAQTNIGPPPPGAPFAPTPLLLPAQTPSTIAARQQATQQALYGQFQGPAQTPRIIGSEAELPRPPAIPASQQQVLAFKRQTAVAQKKYDDLVKSKQPLTNARKAEIQAALDTLQAARQAEMNAIQNAMPTEAPPTPKGTSKKKVIEAPDPQEQNILDRLLSEESGQASPIGSLMPFLTPLIAGRAAIRAISQGPAAVRALYNGLVQSQAFGKVADATRFLADQVEPYSRLTGKAATVRDSVADAWDDLWHKQAATPFPTLNSAIDGARKLFVSRFGQPPEFMVIEEAARTLAIRLESEMLGYVRKVLDDVGDDNVRMAQLYEDIENPSYAGFDPLVLEGKAVSAKASDELNKVGALADSALARWKGTYMPREYMKILMLNPEAGGLLNIFKQMADDVTLSGYYHRGIKETVPASQVSARLASGQGWEVIDPRFTGANAGTPIPTGTRVDMWRDFTKAERNSWGEIKDVARAFHKYSSQLRREIENGSILEGLRTGSDSRGAFAETPANLGLAPNQRPKEITAANGDRYIYLGTTERKGGPIPKFGTLNDHYVRDDVYHYVTTSSELSNLKMVNRTLKKVLGVNWWKEVQTIGNTRYFVNNFFVGMPTLELAGGSIADLPKAARMLSMDDPLVQQLRARGTIQNGQEARELALRIADPLSAAAPTATGIAKAMSLPGDMLKKYRAGAFNVSGATDDLYRVALVDRLMRTEGKTLDEAARVAEDALYNRAAVTAPVALAAEPFIPFYHVAHWTFSKVPKYTIQNPAKAAYLASVASVMPFISELIYGTSKEKGKAQRELLPEQMRDLKIPFTNIKSPIQGLGFPNAIRFGTDESGQPRYIDTNTWNMLVQMGGGTSGTAIPYYPRALSPGGPLVTAAGAYFNLDPFTRRQIVEKDQYGRPINPEEQFDPTMQTGLTGYAARNLLPSVIRDVSGLGMAALGVPSPSRVQTDVPTRLMQMGGLKVRPLPTMEQISREQSAMQRSIQSLDEEQSFQRRRYFEGLKMNNEALQEDALKRIEEIQLLKQQRSQENMQRLEKVIPALGQ